MSEILRQALVELGEIDRGLVSYRASHRNISSFSQFSAAGGVVNREQDRIASEIRRLTLRQNEIESKLAARVDLEAMIRALAVAREQTFALKSHAGIVDLIRLMVADLVAVERVATSELLRRHEKSERELQPLLARGDEISIRLHHLHAAFGDLWAGLQAVVAAGRGEVAVAIGREIADDLTADAKRIEAYLKEVGLMQ